MATVMDSTRTTVAPVGLTLLSEPPEAIIKDASFPAALVLSWSVLFASAHKATVTIRKLRKNQARFSRFTTISKMSASFEAFVSATI